MKQSLLLILLTLGAGSMAHADTEVAISSRGVEGTKVVVHDPSPPDPAGTVPRDRAYDVHLKSWREGCTGADLLFLCVGGHVIPKDPAVTLSGG